MAEHRATVLWRRDAGDFAKGHYSRAHLWRFDGGVEVTASAAPSVVPAPWSKAEAVDPEEAFVASLSSCHMLTFLDLARHRGFVVDSYSDDAVGILSKNDAGHRWVSEVTLNPRIVFSGKQPTAEDLTALHRKSHDICFVANSVRSNVIIAPAPAAATGDQA
jgi:organic hydroperoxide reductase OsmC/OhrA